MRIALATTEFLTEKTFDGGLANYVFRVAESLITFGHIPVIFVASDKNEVLIFKNIEVVRINEKQFTWWFWFLNVLTLFRLNPSLLFVLRSYRIKSAILKYNKTRKIDIAQYTNSMSLGILLPSKIPCVIRISSYQKLLDEVYGHKQTFRLWQKQFLQDLMLKNSQFIFGPSKKIGDFISKKFNKNVEIIESPFLVDKSVFDETILNEILTKTSQNPYLLYFGSLTVLKGVTDIAEILNDFFEKHNEYYFVFVGKTIDVDGVSILEILKEKAGKYYDRIIWKNSLEHKFLYPIIEKADLVVLPSRIDNFPNTCIEAMAIGKIVIGTFETSFEQLIDNNISGILCKPANPQSLINTIDFALKLNNDDKQKMSQNAIDRIEKLKPEIVVKKLIDYYKTVIERNNNHQSV
ncbi:MAG: glycosyltransferase family 4 protein [Bacteroidetes bacterium]|nr:glycosyltransferase family 4 protein [Bacteroidota bacterium]